MTFDDIQSSCENKGSEEMEPQPLPNRPGLAKNLHHSNVNFSSPLKRLIFCVVFLMMMAHDFLAFWRIWFVFRDMKHHVNYVKFLQHAYTEFWHSTSVDKKNGISHIRRPYLRPLTVSLTLQTKPDHKLIKTAFFLSQCLGGRHVLISTVQTSWYTQGSCI